MVLILATPARTRKGDADRLSIFIYVRRLDVAYQQQGDFKETFNMGKFADPTYKQNLPPIIASHWTEIQVFQKECHAVTLKVLTLFALALNVIAIVGFSVDPSYRKIILRNSTMQLTMS